MRALFDAADVQRVMGDAARAVQPSARDLLRTLAVQAENAAVRLSSGSGSAASGAYPIPVRTGSHRRSFGFEVGDDYAIVFNSGVAARALHDGSRPYGNPHARPIPARPYFDDALQLLNLDAAAQAWAESLGGMPA